MGVSRTPSAAGSSALRRFARTTPGVIGTIGIAITVACVVAGVVCAAQLSARIADHGAVLHTSEPVAYAAQNLYAALSAADAAATSAFLSGGNQTAQLRTEYQNALADASAALVEATTETADPQTRETVARISVQISDYSGLVEAARANNVQGFPIGSAYLREASALMQTQLLPAAETIYNGDLAAVEQDVRGVGSTPVLGLAMLFVVLLVIAAGSLALFSRTNRQFNIGLVLAAALVVVVAGWLGVATRMAAADADESRTAGTARFEQLTKARILAAKARTNETLQLIAHGDITADEQRFAAHIAELTALLDTGPAAAPEGVRNWTASHHQQVQAYLAGNYPAAVAQAIGPDPAASAAQFATVEASLHAQLEQTRATLRDKVSNAGDALSGSPTGAALLLVGAAAAAVAGLWPRLKEFL